jgi:hypothetical protein
MNLNSCVGDRHRAAGVTRFKMQVNATRNYEEEGHINITCQISCLLLRYGSSGAQFYRLDIRERRILPKHFHVDHTYNKLFHFLFVLVRLRNKLLQILNLLRDGNQG